MYSLILVITSFLTFVELNCENLFDYQHDSLKNDYEYLPEGNRYWNKSKYWHKVNNIAKEIVSCSRTDENNPHVTHLPDLVALCEVENDSVMVALTRRSLLRNAHYNYFITDSNDERGIDVALLFRNTFTPINHYSLYIAPISDMRHTRDILYVSGVFNNQDTLHIFVLHAPSRLGGEQATRPNRIAVANRLSQSIDSITAICPSANIIVAGDFNDYTNDKSLNMLYLHNLTDATANAQGINGAKGTYKYQGRWGSLDHILLSLSLQCKVHSVYINDLPFLTQEDIKYGGRKPYRTYNGFKYQRNGYSDHLPLVLHLDMQ